ncbi:MAG: curli-like amyloid fiber formation chaperone CsgH [Paracoccaceae bacterium]
MAEIFTLRRHRPRRQSQSMTTGRALSLVLPALILGACMAVYPQKAVAMKEIQCEIRSRPVDRGVELVGVVWSDNEAAGGYSFIVKSEGPSGSSNVAQRGLFSLQANKPRVIGTVMVNSRAGDRFLARLTITSDGTEICSAQI